MRDEFEETGLTKLDEFLTVFKDTSFNFGEPIGIGYESTAVFDEESTVVPTIEMLDRVLATAFNGNNLNGFIGMLQALPPQNVFSTTVFVNQTESSSQGAQSVRRKQNQKERVATAAGAVAGAAAILMITAGLVYFKRRKEDQNTGIVTVHKDSEENYTVAGETYTGAWSVDPSESLPLHPDDSDRSVDTSNACTAVLMYEHPQQEMDENAEPSAVDESPFEEDSDSEVIEFHDEDEFYQGRDEGIESETQQLAESEVEYVETEVIEGYVETNEEDITRVAIELDGMMGPVPIS